MSQLGKTKMAVTQTRLTGSLRNLRKYLKQHKELIGYVFLGSILLLFAYRNLPLGNMFAYADLPPFPGDPHLLWVRFASVWQNEHLGFQLPEISFQVVVGILILILGDPNVAQKILLLSAVPCAMISMNVLSGRFVRSYPSRYLSSFVYGLNPVIIGRFVNGGPLDVLFLYALLPLLWLQLIKIVNEHKVLDVLLFAVLFGIIGSRIYAVFWAVVPFASMLVLVKLAKKPRHGRSSLWGIGIVLLSFSLGFMLVLPDTLLAFQRNETLVPQSETLIEAVNWAYSTPNPLNLAWLGGNGGDLMMRSLGYNDISPYTVLGLIIPLIAFSSIFLSEKEKREYIVLFSALVGTAICFISLTRLKITYPLFQVIPQLFSLKNPVKIIYPLALALCSLFGIGLDGIAGFIRKRTNSIRQKDVQVAIFNASVLVLIVLFLFPVIGGGTVGLNEVYGDSYSVPSNYLAVLNWINEQRQSYGFFRTLWLPYDYSTQIRLEASDPYNVGLRSGAAWLNMPNIDFVKDLFETICKGNMENFSELLTILDVKYVIIDLDSPYTTECRIVEKQVTPWIVGEPIYFKNMIERQDHMYEVYRIGDLVVYENREFEASHFSIYDSLVFLTCPLPNESITSASPLTPNLLENPSFENGLKPWWADKKVTVDNQTFTEGNHSARIDNNDTEKWASIAQSVYVERGGTYRFSAWVKTQGSNGSHIKLVWSNENKTAVRTDYIVEKGEIGVSIDWLHIAEAITAPANATEVSIRLIGGLSSNGEVVATTWFDNVEFYEIPDAPSDSFAQSFLTLTDVPGFISAEHLVIFEKGLARNEILEALNVSDIIAFSHPTIDQLKEYANLVHTQKLVQIFEAETLSAPGRKLVLDNSMSNGEAIVLNRSALSLEFYAPIVGYYQIGFNDLSGNASVLVDDLPLALTNEYKTEALQLEEGNHTLRISGNNSVLDQIQILSAENVEDLDKFFNTENSTDNIANVESSTGHYSIQAEIGKPSFLVLGESYDSDWRANTDTENLKHFRAFGWSNAFYVQKTGTTEVEISFAQQPLRDMTINIWILCWIAVSVALIWSWIRKRRHGRTQSTALDQCMLLRLQNCHRRQSWRRIDRV
jgi:hypothetical protein